MRSVVSDGPKNKSDFGRLAALISAAPSNGDRRAG